MATAKDQQEHMARILTETLTLLCKTGLQYKTNFSIKALIGITLDDDDIILVDIKETVRDPNISTNGTSSPRVRTNLPTLLQEGNDSSADDGRLSPKSREKKRKRKGSNPIRISDSSAAKQSRGDGFEPSVIIDNVNDVENDADTTNYGEDVDLTYDSNGQEADDDMVDLIMVKEESNSPHLQQPLTKYHQSQAMFNEADSLGEIRGWTSNSNTGSHESQAKTTKNILIDIKDTKISSTVEGRFSSVENREMVSKQESENKPSILLHNIDLAKSSSNTNKLDIKIDQCVSLSSHQIRKRKPEKSLKKKTIKRSIPSENCSTNDACQSTPVKAQTQLLKKCFNYDPKGPTSQTMLKPKKSSKKVMKEYNGKHRSKNDELNGQEKKKSKRSFSHGLHRRSSLVSSLVQAANMTLEKTESLKDDQLEHCAKTKREEKRCLLLSSLVSSATEQLDGNINQWKNYSDKTEIPLKNFKEIASTDLERSDKEKRLVALRETGRVKISESKINSSGKQMDRKLKSNVADEGNVSNPPSQSTPDRPKTNVGGDQNQSLIHIEVHDPFSESVTPKKHSQSDSRTSLANKIQGEKSDEIQIYSTPYASSKEKHLVGDSFNAFDPQSNGNAVSNENDHDASEISVKSKEGENILSDDGTDSAISDDMETKDIKSKTERSTQRKEDAGTELAICSVSNSPIDRNQYSKKKNSDYQTMQGNEESERVENKENKNMHAITITSAPVSATTTNTDFNEILIQSVPKVIYDGTLGMYKLNSQNNSTITPKATVSTAGIGRSVSKVVTKRQRKCSSTGEVKKDESLTRKNIQDLGPIFVRSVDFLSPPAGSNSHTTMNTPNTSLNKHNVQSPKTPTMTILVPVCQSTKGKLQQKVVRDVPKFASPPKPRPILPKPVPAASTQNSFQMAMIKENELQPAALTPAVSQPAAVTMFSKTPLEKESESETDSGRYMANQSERTDSIVRTQIRSSPRKKMRKMDPSNSKDNNQMVSKIETENLQADDSYVKRSKKSQNKPNLKSGKRHKGRYRTHGAFSQIKMKRSKRTLRSNKIIKSYESGSCESSSEDMDRSVNRSVTTRSRGFDRYLCKESTKSSGNGKTDTSKPHMTTRKAKANVDLSDNPDYENGEKEAHLPRCMDGNVIGTIVIAPKAEVKDEFEIDYVN